MRAVGWFAIGLVVVWMVVAPRAGIGRPRLRLFDETARLFLGVPRADGDAVATSRPAPVARWRIVGRGAFSALLVGAAVWLILSGAEVAGWACAVLAVLAIGATQQLVAADRRARAAVEADARSGVVQRSRVLEPDDVRFARRRRPPHA